MSWSKVGQRVVIVAAGPCWLLAGGALPARALTLGKTTVGATNGGALVANAKRVNAYRLDAPASVSKMDIYLSPSGTTGTEVMEGVIYADAGGSPGSLIRQSRQIAFSSTSAKGWYDLPFASNVVLSPGAYWLGIYTGGAKAAAYWYDQGSSSRARLANNQTYAENGASNPFGAIGWSDSYLMSLYATYSTPTWKVQPAPAPSSQGSQLNAVSCPSSSACTAVGSYQTSAGRTVTLAERWNGTSWAIQSTPNPSGATSSNLEGVSCSSTAACTAVGSYINSAGRSVTLAERWNGTSWSIQTTPNPAGTADISLSAVSCTSTTACIAVGGFGGSIAERWNGTSWVIQNTPSGGGSLYGVSCTTSTACTAVGDGSASGIGGAERWNGTTWSIQNMPAAPPQSSGGLLWGVSCPTTSACFAGGGVIYTDPEPAALQWNGTRWSLTNFVIADSGYARGISCASATACVAAGSYFNPGGTWPFIEQWNGSAWSVPSTPPVTSGELRGTSCSSAIACTAVGENFSTNSPLVERYS